MRMALAGALCLLLAAACGESPVRPKPAELGKPFDLRVGETALLEGEDLRVGFERVSEDSRCPAGVQCVWEGDAVAHVSLVKDAREKSTHALHTSGRFAQQASYLGYRVVLVGLAPYPKASRPIPPRDYVATLRVEAGP